MKVIHKESLCINCGCCVSECNSMESDPDFLGPAALAKGMRFVGDPRDGAIGLLEQLRQRLGAAEHGDEVGVARPAGHDVLVQVLRQRAAGDAAEVDPDVERVRAADLLEHPRPPAGWSPSARRPRPS